ncbi:MAG: hypothetical protein K2N82_00325 [Lachnospiraceae bacterium]|nr:hypothetical protein [Lachnospiraceae bacterium]
MADKDVVRISFRLNLQNEQHQRIYRVLAALDKDIHKSTNQFIANAVDFYIRSFDGDELLEKPEEKKKPKYITVEELADIRREIKSDVKDEIIRLLGSAIAGGSAVRIQQDREDSIQTGGGEEKNPVVSELANRWG